MSLDMKLDELFSKHRQAIVANSQLYKELQSCRDDLSYTKLVLQARLDEIEQLKGEIREMRFHISSSEGG